MSKDQKVIGITGGIASGKSTFADLVEKNGFKVIRSDQTAKTLMNENQELKEKIKMQFGDDFYIDGTVNREYVSNLIFGDKNKKNRDKLNSIVHPFVIEDNFRTIERLIAEDERMVFVESALIFEAGLQEGYDYIVNIHANEEIVSDRLKKRNNFSDEEIKQRLESQYSPQYKKSHSDFSIDNNGNLNEFISSSEMILSLLENLPGKDPKKYEEVDN